jgi:hypothetical protein
LWIYTTGDEVTTTEGGAGEGEGFRGGVCARGDAVCGTGSGLSFFECLSCLSVFFESLSGEDVPEDDGPFLSPLSFLCRLSYTQTASMPIHNTTQNEGMIPFLP